MLLELMGVFNKQQKRRASPNHLGFHLGPGLAGGRVDAARLTIKGMGSFYF